MPIRIAGMLCHLLLCVTVSLSLTASAKTNLLVNPDFETPTTAPNAPPAAWTVVGDGPVLQTNPPARSGKVGAGVQKKTGTRFGGLGQSLDATTLRGKVLVFNAWLKSQDVGTGTSGVWMRGDGETRRSIQFVHSYANPVSGTSDWVQRSVRMLVSPDITSIQVGIALDTSGSLSVDDASLMVAERGAVGETSASARQYLDQAITIIRNRAMNREKLDWNALVPSIELLADGAQKTSDTYAAISYALSALGDRHSRLVPPTNAAAQQANARTDDFGIVTQKLDVLAYVKVPAYAGGASSRNDAFAVELKSRLTDLSAGYTCGWIVDLRGNSGGNMWPMLGGLQPLLGEGTVGYFVASTPLAAWKLDATKAQSAAVTGFAPLTTTNANGLSGTPVAVLYGPMTSSSGEAVAVAFIGRPSTRSFGQPTAGLSTANSSIPLMDGALMLLTTSAFADRTGKIYGQKIDPDERIEAAKSVVALSDDPVVQAAKVWLSGAPACTQKTK